MFTLKHNHRFGQLGRRGLDAVRNELMLKVLAYNFDRTILIRNRHTKSKQAKIPLAA